MSPRRPKTDSVVITQVSRATNPAADTLQPRRMPRQERARTTVAAITEAAGQLLVDRGYAKVSTNLIAKRAGVSVGSLYQYFPNKESIYRAIIEEHMLEMKGQADQAMITMADESHDFATGLRKVLDSMVAVHTRDDDLMRAIEVELSQVCPHQASTRDSDDQVVEEIAAILDQRTDCQPADPRVAARLLLICCQGVTKWLLHRAPRDADVQDYLTQAVAMCALAVNSREQADPGTT